MHRGSSTTLSAGTLLPHCCYSTLYRIALFCAITVTGLPYTDCYPTAFSVAGSTAWNGVPVALRLMPVGHSAPLLSGPETSL